MDDVPVLGETAAEQAGSTGRQPRLAVGLGALAVVTVAILAIGGGEAPATDTVVAVPVLTVPPTIPEPKLVDRTLEWSPVTGLEEIDSVAGVVDLGERVVAVATVADQIQVYLTDDGREWEPGAVLGLASEWPLVIDLGGEVAVVLNHRDPVAGSLAPDLVVSTDGADWETHVLPLPEGYAGATVSAGVGFDDGLVMGGWAEAGGEARTDILETLPDAVAQLVAAGTAWMETRDSELEVRLGGLVVYRRTFESDEVEALSSMAQTSGMWSGAVDNLEFEAPMVEPMGVLSDGRLVAGQGGSMLLTSVDADDWTRVSTRLQAWQAHVWKDLIVGPSADGSEILAWDSVTEEVATITPDGLPRDGAWPQRISSGDAGMAALFLSGGFIGLEDEVPVLSDGDLEWVLADGFSVLELRRGGELVGQANLWETTASLTEVGLSIEVEDEVLVIDPDAWLEAVSPWNVGTDYSARVLHTLDGIAWSLTTPQGGPTLREPVVFVTDEFVLLTEQWLGETDGPGQAWVGYPTG